MNDPTCERRWPDEMSARAGALFAIETYKRESKLYVYRCPTCRGWHLTKFKQDNSEPVIAAGVAEKSSVADEFDEVLS